MTVPQDDVTSVTVGQFYPYSAGQVWQAITSATLVSDWTAGEDAKSFKAGTKFTLATFPLPEVGFAGSGECEFIELVPNERMAYRFTTPEKAWDLLVTWTLHPESGGTRLLVVHNGFDAARPSHERLRDLVRDIWNMVTFRISEVLESSAAEEPPAEDAASFTLGEFYPHPREHVWRVVTSKEFVGEVVNEHDLHSVETGRRLTISTYPIPIVGFTGKVEMEFLEVREPELIVCTFEIPIMEGRTVLHNTWRFRPKDGGTQLWFTLSGFDPRSQLNRQLRAVLHGGAVPVFSRIGELLEGRGPRN
ncbi:SRPBCC domain-containing protein [Mycobacterium sp. CBMA271]|uniref:SRPBCC family protein n=1 Tax=unclassified Mycobacteroides TaxID=2618759 RepID=UPI0012DD1141|nr:MULTISPECIES: SRPBCC family protein [unclassified Mycobacteroides]MUM15431.1 hypothetical protein [Mycobacteroides sp. CBMA 326]MUM21332.1 SRPBCC domain-containing protein [Mycobacteroides sp. CBMA 271]